MKNLKQAIQKICGKFRHLPISAVLLLILLTAAMLRVSMLQRFPYPLRDELFYLQIVETWKERGMTAVYALPNMTLPPGYPGLLILLHHFTGWEIETVGNVWGVISGGLLVLLLYGIGRELATASFGLLCAFLGAVHPELIESSGRLLRESTALMFLAAFAWLFLKWLRQKRHWRLLAAGITLGLAVITRVEFLEFYVYTILLRGLLNFRQKKILLWSKEMLLLSGGILLGLAAVSLLFGVNADFWLDTLGMRIWYRITSLLGL